MDSVTSSSSPMQSKNSPMTVFANRNENGVRDGSSFWSNSVRKAIAAKNQIAKCKVNSIHFKFGQGDIVRPTTRHGCRNEGKRMKHWLFITKRAALWVIQNMCLTHLNKRLEQCIK